jgi:hypothetical protein
MKRTDLPQKRKGPLHQPLCFRSHLVAHAVTNSPSPHELPQSLEAKALSLSLLLGTRHRAAVSPVFSNYREPSGLQSGLTQRGMEVKGLGQLLAALFLRVIAAPGPGPALLSEAEDTRGGGGVPPVNIRWARISCALKNKRGEVVSRYRLRHRTLISHLAGGGTHETFALDSAVFSLRWFSRCSCLI